MVTTKVGNNNFHRILVDNGNAMDILYLNTYNRMGLTQESLRSIPTPLYGFTRDSLMPHGKISSPITISEYPHMSIVVTKFLVVDCASAYNVVFGRLTLKALKAVTSIYHLMMKLPTPEEIGYV